MERRDEQTRRSAAFSLSVESPRDGRISRDSLLSLSLAASFVPPSNGDERKSHILAGSLIGQFRRFYQRCFFLYVEDRIFPFQSCSILIFSCCRCSPSIDCFFFLSPSLITFALVISRVEPSRSLSFSLRNFLFSPHLSRTYCRSFAFLPSCIPHVKDGGAFLPTVSTLIHIDMVTRWTNHPTNVGQRNQTVV